MITVEMFSSKAFSLILRLMTSFWYSSLSERDTVFIVPAGFTKNAIGFSFPVEESSLFDLSAAFSIVILKALVNKGGGLASCWAPTEVGGGGISMLGTRTPKILENEFSGSRNIEDPTEAVLEIA
jgi:hypothetical protein